MNQNNTDKEIANKKANPNSINQDAFVEISEIRDIVASANMGIWRIELVENEEPRMYVDTKMKELLGISGIERSPEETYTDWFSNILPSAVPSVLESVKHMENGFFDENTYKWIHPSKGVRYVRCGGTADVIPGGFSLKGYHYDVDEVVRKDKAQAALLQKALDDRKEYYETLGALGDIFYSMHVLDLINDTATEFNAKNEVKSIVNHKHGATEMMKQVMNAVIADEYMEAALEFTDLSTLADRMKDKVIVTKELVGKNIGWFLASFISMERDEQGRPTKVIFTSRVIDEEKKQEEKLIRKTQTDELTGLLNRRAYEEDIYIHNDIPEEDEYIYISLDVNGLKVINDTLGHMAGDELIIGACQCMKKVLGPHGKLYRIGGDEFVAILTKDTKNIKSVLTDFDKEINNWSGELIDSISISYGYVSKQEKEGKSVRQLSAIAEKRMYDAKDAYYQEFGIDRRGQQEAHKALCALYTKILKINITDDTYHIINMDDREQTKEMGFSDKISEWFSSFGNAGLVHPEDLQDFLKATDLKTMRRYFMDGNKSLHIFYRRKYEEGFKPVMMEIIPSNDYSDDNQNLFLYVKNI